MSPLCTARNNNLLLLPLLGENWHNNHHGSPRSATTWVHWWEIDCQLLVLRVLEYLGFVSDIVIEPPEQHVPGYVPGSHHAAWAFAEWAAWPLILLVLARAQCSVRRRLSCAFGHPAKGVEKEALLESAAFGHPAKVVDKQSLFMS